MCLRTRRDDHFSEDSSNSHYLAAFNYFPTVAFWLPAGNAALLALIKDDTSFELCIGRFREPRRDHPSFSANHTAASGWILESHCSAGFLNDVQPSVGVVCGSDNHMFAKIHSPDRITRSATNIILGQGAQSD